MTSKAMGSGARHQPILITDNLRAAPPNIPGRQTLEASLNGGYASFENDPQCTLT